MQNKLSDLNNYLFAQLERLDDERLTDEQLSVETSRAKAITDVAKTIIDNAELVLNAAKYSSEYGDKSKRITLLLE